jgi:alpha-tubulin suppressor-like RCC1 family protein
VTRWALVFALAACGRFGFDPIGHDGGDGGVQITDGFVAGNGDTSCIAQIDIGWQHVCVLATDGRVWCWGFGEQMQLGDGKLASRAYPARAPGFPADTIAISTGGYHDCAIDSAHHLSCLGANYKAQLATGSTSAPSATAVPITLPANVKVVSAGDEFTCAMLTNQSVACWGDDDDGQIGNNTVAPFQATPQINALDVITIAAGIHHVCALDFSATLVCWGDNAFGQLGNNSTMDSHVPTPGESAAEFLIAADHTCAYANGGRQCFGRNGNGQVGDGTRIDLIEPASTDPTPLFASMTAGYRHSCGLTAAGALWCWGENDRGQVGNGMTDDVLAPVQVLDNVKMVAAGDKFTCALLNGGPLECWGDNTNGQLGDNSIAPSMTPKPTLFSCDLP